MKTVSILYVTKCPLCTLISPLLKAWRSLQAMKIKEREEEEKEDKLYKEKKTDTSFHFYIVLVNPNIYTYKYSTQQTSVYGYKI